MEKCANFQKQLAQRIEQFVNKLIKSLSNIHYQGKQLHAYYTLNGPFD